MRALDAVDLSFFEGAPHLVRHQAYVARPRHRVFAAVATDPAGWGRWFPGFSDDGRWETPPPHGVGSGRSVRAFGVRYRETILAWEQDTRWAFRVDETSLPMFKGFAEDYALADDGPGTRLTWTVAMRPRPGLSVGMPVIRLALGAVLRRAASRLSRL